MSDSTSPRPSPRGSPRLVLPQPVVSMPSVPDIAGGPVRTNSVDQKQRKRSPPKLPPPPSPRTVLAATNSGIGIKQVVLNSHSETTTPKGSHFKLTRTSSANPAGGSDFGVRVSKLKDPPVRSPSSGNLSSVMDKLNSPCGLSSTLPSPQSQLPDLAKEKRAPNASGGPSPSASSVPPPSQKKDLSSETPDEKTRRQRKERANEMLETEKSYVRSLTLVSNEFVAPLKKMVGRSEEIVSKQDLFCIFSNWEILLTSHAKLLAKIQTRLDDWNNNDRLGDIFKDYTGFIKLYKYYVNNYDNAISLLDEVKKKRPGFDDMVKGFDYSPRANGLNLPSYLIMPVQRIPRYVLLLNDILKLTDDSHADYPNLKEALSLIKELADYINRNKRKADDSAKLTSIAETLSGFPSGQKLVTKTRAFVKEGSLKMVKKDTYHCFLFNDMLMFTKQRGKKYKYSGNIALATATLNPDSTDCDFEIISTSGRFKWLAEDKDIWIKEINKNIESARNAMFDTAFTGGQEKEEQLEGSRKFQELQEKEASEKRFNLIKDLERRDNEYCESIYKTRDVFLNPMKELPSAVISPNEINQIFNNLHTICETHSAFHDKINQRIASWEEHPQIGTLFLDHLGTLAEQYLTYLSGHVKAKKLLEMCLKNSNAFAMFLMELESREKTTLADELDKPLRLVSMYYLLLNELFQTTPQRHPDREPLSQVVDQLKQQTERMEREKLSMAMAGKDAFSGTKSSSSKSSRSPFTRRKKRSLIRVNSNSSNE